MKNTDITLQIGDYVSTEGMTEEVYYKVAAAFTEAGFRPYSGCDEQLKYRYLCADSDGDLVGCGGLDYILNRKLTVDQVLNAKNAGKTSKEAMHIRDQLMQARKERDEAQSKYEDVLAKHREAYPWLVVEERKQDGGDMSDPNNWRIGDMVECVVDAEDLTVGNTYPILYMESGWPKVKDDVGDEVVWDVDNFRWHSRP